MSRSGQSIRSTSSSSSGKIPLSCQSDSKKRATFDSAGYDDRYPEPRYTTTLSEPRSASSSSKSSRSSKSDKTPLSISYGPISRDDGRSSKTVDQRYYPDSSLDPRQIQKKPLSCQTKENDQRYYQNSSYYR